MSYVAMAFDPSRFVSFQRLDDFPGHLTAIGLVTTEWVRLEFTLQMTLITILNNADHATVVWEAIVSFRTRMDVLKALIDECVPEQGFREKFTDVIKEIESISRKRNQLVHTIWGVRASDDALLQPRSKRWIRKEPQFDVHFNDKRIRNLADEMTEISMRLHELNNDFYDARHSKI